MPVLTTASQFVGACLLLGLGLFLAAEAWPQVRQRLTLTAAGHLMAVLGGLVMVVAGGYWVSVTVPW